MTSPTIKTRILIISDTHCAPLTGQDESSKTPPRPFTEPLPNADLLIHCGDLTNTGRIIEYHHTLDMLKKIDAPVKLVIPGNHDLSLDRDFALTHRATSAPSHAREFIGLTDGEAESYVNEARDLWTSPSGRAKAEGVTFLDEGIHDIALPNGTSVRLYASPYTPEFCDWAFPYKHTEDRFNPPSTSLSDAENIAPYPVPDYTRTDRPIDILLTHGPPYGRLDKTSSGILAGCPHLLRALMRSRPLIHCFGHIHEGSGVELVRWSEQADQVACATSTIGEWKDSGWKAGVQNVEAVGIDARDLVRRRAGFVDMTKNGRDFVRGSGTAVVNASIMDVGYRPVNAPWVVDVDLPKTAVTAS